jgi:sRNA-binding carbon storage regulator CsrA
MLVLRRKKREAVVVTVAGVRLRVVVSDIDLRGTVQLAFDAPPEVQVNREEVQSELDAIAAGRLVDVK